MISERFVWKKLNSDVKLRCESCADCHKGKIQRHTRSKVQQIPVPPRRFSHIHVKIVGPLPSSSGFTHLFTIIDRSTRWLEAIPLSATSTKDFSEALFFNWSTSYN